MCTISVEVGICLWCAHFTMLSQLHIWWVVISLTSNFNVSWFFDLDIHVQGYVLSVDFVCLFFLCHTYSCYLHALSIVTEEHLSILPEAFDWLFFETRFWLAFDYVWSICMYATQAYRKTFNLYTNTGMCMNVSKVYCCHFCLLHLFYVLHSWLTNNTDPWFTVSGCIAVPY